MHAQRHAPLYSSARPARRAVRPRRREYALLHDAPGPLGGRLRAGPRPARLVIVRCPRHARSTHRPAELAWGWRARPAVDPTAARCLRIRSRSLVRWWGGQGGVRVEQAGRSGLVTYPEPRTAGGGPLHAPGAARGAQARRAGARGGRRHAPLPGEFLRRPGAALLEGDLTARLWRALGRPGPPLTPAVFKARAAQPQRAAAGVLCWRVAGWMQLLR